MKFSRRSWSFFGEKPLSLYVVLYTIISYLGIFYLLYLPIRCFISGTEIVLYNIPSIIISVFSIYKMTQKELSYKITIELESHVVWIFLIFMYINSICFSLIVDKYTFDYHFISFWKNISIFTQYNDFFFFVYNIISMFLLSVLLTFNSIKNVKTYYYQQKQKGCPTWCITIWIIILLFVSEITLFKYLKEITSSFFYFLAITFISGLHGILLSRMTISIFLPIYSLFERKPSND